MKILLSFILKLVPDEIIVVCDQVLTLQIFVLYIYIYIYTYIHTYIQGDSRRFTATIGACSRYYFEQLSQ